MPPDWEELRRTDWLRHEWTFSVRPCPFSHDGRHLVEADGVGVGTFASHSAAKAWLRDRRSGCLAELIARHPAMHPVEVIIDSLGSCRLGRIRPELWGGYDALEVGRTEALITALSAKARAAFANEPAVFLRIHHAPGVRERPRRRQAATERRHRA